jgi:predicted RNA-binding Zn ribbon-like protein
MGLAVVLSDLGIDRFGVCQAPGCGGVFIDFSDDHDRIYCSEKCGGPSGGSQALLTGD